MTEEFNFKKELEKIWKEELVGRQTNAGRIYRRLRLRDKEFISRLKESNIGFSKTEDIEIINKLSGEDGM